MNQIQVFISGLILLLPGAVESHTAVQGLAGHPVTLPCIYSTHLGGIVPMCWGLGECRHSYCIRSLIWTNGYTVTHQRNSRYQLKGNISEGNVSLTIENTVVGDGGPYCCVVEIPGAFHFVDYMLEVKPEISTSPPTRPTATGRPTTISTRSTHVPTSTRVSTSTSPTPAHTETYKPEATTFYPDQTTAEVTETLPSTPADWHNTVTSSDDPWDDNTEVIPPQKPQKNLNKGFYVGISIAALLILMLLSTMVITRYVVMKRKSESLRFFNLLYLRRSFSHLQSSLPSLSLRLELPPKKWSNGPDVKTRSTLLKTLLTPKKSPSGPLRHLLPEIKETVSDITASRAIFCVGSSSCSGEGNPLLCTLNSSLTSS